MEFSPFVKSIIRWGHFYRFVSYAVIYIDIFFRKAKHSGFIPCCKFFDVVIINIPQDRRLLRAYHLLQAQRIAIKVLIIKIFFRLI